MSICGGPYLSARRARTAPPAWCTSCRSDSNIQTRFNIQVRFNFPTQGGLSALTRLLNIQTRLIRWYQGVYDMYPFCFTIIQILYACVTFSNILSIQIPWSCVRRCWAVSPAGRYQTHARPDRSAKASAPAETPGPVYFISNIKKRDFRHSKRFREDLKGGEKCFKINGIK